MASPLKQCTFCAMALRSRFSSAALPDGSAFDWNQRPALVPMMSRGPYAGNPGVLTPMWPFTKTQIVPVLRFHGHHRHGDAAAARLVARGRRRLDRKGVRSSRKLPSVAVADQFAGRFAGAVESDFQAHPLSLPPRTKKTVYVFCEDVAASGGYFLAVAGDEIYADPSSIVGSIGVISASFGFVEAIDKLGIERRVYTAGLNKEHARSVPA